MVVVCADELEGARLAQDLAAFAGIPVPVLGSRDFTFHNAAVVSLEQLVNMFNMGGFACGIGEWRIEKGGTFGAYHVE